MFTHAHHHRLYRFSLREGREIYELHEIHPSDYHVEQNEAMLARKSTHLEQREKLRNNESHQDLLRALDEFGYLKSYPFLSEQSDHKHFHRSMISSLVLLESQNIPSIDTSDPGRRFLIVNHYLEQPEMPRFSGINDEAFKNRLGTTEADIRERMDEYGLLEEYEILHPGTAAPAPTIDDLKNVAFEVWLRSFAQPILELDEIEESNSMFSTLYKRAHDSGTFGSKLKRLSPTERNRYGSLEFTLLRYKKVLRDVYDAFGEKPQGSILFHRLPENDRARIIARAWYGGTGFLDQQLNVFQSDIGRGDAVRFLVGLREFYYEDESRSPVNEPHPREWVDNPGIACEYLRDVVLPNIKPGSVPASVQIAIVDFANGKTPSPDRLIAIEQLMGLISPAVPVQDADSSPFTIRDADSSPEAGGNLAFIAEVRSVSEQVESPQETIRSHLGIDNEDIKALRNFYQMQEVPIEISAERWGSSPEAAQSFLYNLPQEPPDSRTAKIRQKIENSGFMDKLDQYILKRQGLLTPEQAARVNDEEVRDALNALAEDLVTMEVIHERSAQKREALSAISTMTNFLGESWEDYKDLWNKPGGWVAGVIIGYAAFKGLQYLLFSKQNLAKLGRVTVFGGGMALYIAEKYNPFGIKETIDNRLRGDRWVGTIERFHAERLVDENGEKLVEGNDDVRHLALQNIRSVPTDELISFYEDVRSRRRGNEGQPNTEKDIYRGLQMPLALRSLERQTTQKLGKKDMIDEIYVPLIEGVLAQYSDVHGGPEGGVGARVRTGGYESKVADGLARIKEEVIDQGATRKSLHADRKDLLLRYAIIARDARNNAFVSLDSQRKILDTRYAVDSYPDDLASLTGYEPGGALYTEVISIIESSFLDDASKTDLLDRLKRDLDAADKRNQFTLALKGRNMPFGHFMDAIVEPNEFEQYASAQSRGYIRYLRATGRMGRFGQAYYDPIGAAEDLADDAGDLVYGAIGLVAGGGGAAKPEVDPEFTAPPTGKTDIEAQGNEAENSPQGNNADPNAADNATDPAPDGNEADPDATGNDSDVDAAGNQGSPDASGNDSDPGAQGNNADPSAQGNDADPGADSNDAQIDAQPGNANPGADSNDTDLDARAGDASGEAQSGGADPNPQNA